MSRQDFFATLAEFFREAFAEDPIGVGDWLAQGGQDVDAFVDELERLFPEASDAVQEDGR